MRLILPKEWTGPASLIASIVVLVIVFAFLNPRFASIENFRNILFQVAVPLIIIVGTTLVIQLGSIDLSVQGVMGAAGMAWILLSANTRLEIDLGVWAWVIALGIGVGLGLLAGALHLPHADLGQVHVHALGRVARHLLLAEEARLRRLAAAGRHLDGVLLEDGARLEAHRVDVDQAAQEVLRPRHLAALVVAPRIDEGLEATYEAIVPTAFAPARCTHIGSLRHGGTLADGAWRPKETRLNFMKAGRLSSHANTLAPRRMVDGPPTRRVAAGDVASDGLPDVGGRTS